MTGKTRHRMKRFQKSLLENILWIVAVVVVCCGLLAFGSCASMKDSGMSHENGVVEWELGRINDALPPGVMRLGTPRTIDSPAGKAVEFDGKGDALFFDSDPLLNLRAFTVEVLLRPDADAPAEQRYLHMGEENGERIMLETRVTPENQWYLDAYCRSGDSSKALIDKSLLHPTGNWYHVAFVVDNGLMRTYVDGAFELEGHVPFTPFTRGSSSIGVRMNRRYWFKGAMGTIRITPRSLAPSEFAQWR